MNLAIPALALGGFYVMSNQDKEKKIENYDNSLPGVNPPTPVGNFPIQKQISNDDGRIYRESNQTTDNVFL